MGGGIYLLTTPRSIGPVCKLCWKGEECGLASALKLRATSPLPHGDRLTMLCHEGPVTMGGDRKKEEKCVLS